VGQQLAAPAAPIEITVRTDRTLEMVDRERGSQAVKVSRDELVARVREKQARSPGQPVVIAADKSARYEDVVAVLDLLQRNSVRKVGLLARTQPN
jgi:biopolymer transport protein TolR